MTATARRVAWSLLGNAVAPAASFAAAPVLAHAVGVDGRGAVAAATSPLVLAVAAFGIGLPAATTYFVARTSSHARSVLARATVIALGTGILATLAVLALAPLLAAGDERLAGLIGIAALAIAPSIIAGILQSVAAGFHRWRHVTADRVVGGLGRLVAMLVLAAAGRLDVTTAVLVMALAPLLGSLVYLALVPAMRHRDRPPTGVGYAVITTYGIRTWAGSISGLLLSRLDQVLMAPLASTGELGLYAVAVSIADLGIVANTAVREVMFAQDAGTNDDVALARAARLSTLVAFGFAVVVLATCWWWIPLVFGPDFIAAVPALAVLLLANVVGNPGSLAGAGLAARGRPGLRSWSLLVAAVVNLVLVLVLVPTTGALGAAIATAVGSAVAGTGNVLLLRIVAGVPARRFYGLRRSDLAGLVAVVRRRTVQH